jgi:hypothetical protein
LASFKKYKNFTRSLPITLTTGEILTVTYRPAAYSGDFQKKAAKKAGTISDPEFLQEILVAWDWEDEEGQQIPITSEFINAEVALPDQSAIVKAVFGDIFPNAGEKESTSVSSPSV